MNMPQGRPKLLTFEEAQLHALKRWQRYYFAHKSGKAQKITERNQARPAIVCECGGHYKQHTKTQHFGTAKHRAFIALSGP